MARKDQVRHQLFLPRETSERLEALAAKPGVSKSSLLAAAVTAFLDRRGANELDERFGLRLDRISNTLARIERDGHVQIESLALFIRYMLTVNAPLADEDEVSRAIGRDRFAAFITRVGQQLASGRRSFAAEEGQ
ncbi:MAG TPA: CopG family transcriptional regulator [Allosphingosinicella sp.]|nr:CopG family transcriptional regulator [Allosphingosinicella sp.]